ncbi:response regulator [Ekhidna sp. To15]|uniref:response regulator n=1 Tax=Ekhidna sp. To15 TaxID=3395267 RepID=UPI003F524283
MTDKPAILYVDDEEANLLLFRISFEGERDVLVASSPEEGLLKLEENRNRVRAVISDMNMPKMNGIEFIEKAQETIKDIPYYILSGYAFNDEIEQALQRNTIQKFFTKPFDRAEIETYLSNSNNH